MNRQKMKTLNRIKMKLGHVYIGSICKAYLEGKVNWSIGSGKSRLKVKCQNFWKIFGNCYLSSPQPENYEDAMELPRDFYNIY